MMKSPYEQDPVVSSFYQPLDSDGASPSPFGPKPFNPNAPEYGKPPQPVRKPMEVRGSLSWTDGQQASRQDDPVASAFHAPLSQQDATPPQQMHVASASSATNPDQNQNQNPDPNQTPNPGPDPNPSQGAGNPGIDEATWQTAQQWGSDPGYSWILQNPWAIGEYYQYAAEQQAAGETGIDAVDFFAARGYQSPKAGRAGRDTMKFREDGSPRVGGMGTPDDGGNVHMPQTGGNPDPNKTDPGAEQEIPFVINNPDAEAYWRTRGGAPKPPGTEDANIAASWYRTFPVDEAEKITAEDVTRYRTSGVAMNFGDWWQKVDRLQRDSYGGRNNTGLGGPDGQGLLPGGGGPSGNPPVVSPGPPDEIHRTGGVDPGTTDPGGDPIHQTGGVDPGTTDPGPVDEIHRTGGPDPGAPPPGAGGPDDVVRAIKSLNDMFQPGFESEQKQLLRAMMHAGGVSGQMDSGGFASSVGDKMSGLIANQGQRMGDYAFKDKQNQDALTMQKYIADQENRTRLKELETNSGMQKYIADLNSDLERYKVNTNADLEKMLAEQENTLKRYGIDKGDVLERYKADLQLKGIMYSSDAQVSASGLQAAAAGAGAAAAGAARAAEAEMEYKLGMARLGQENTFNQRQYDLGVYGINRDIYQTDIDNQYKMMMLQWYMSPEARMGGGAPNLPGMTPYP